MYFKPTYQKLSLIYQFYIVCVYSIGHKFNDKKEFFEFYDF